MELNVGKTYLSNNPCFPGQLFHITGYECAKRFGKDNVIITYERWAFGSRAAMPYKIETTKDWLLTNRECIVREPLPDDMQLEFNQMREAVLTANSMIPQ